MNKELYDLAAWSIKTATSAGADECRVGIQKNRFVEISYRERKPESVKEASERSLTIEFFVNHRYTSQSTSDLRKDTLKDFISNAVAATKLLAEDPYRSLPDPKYYQGRPKVDLQIVDPGHKRFLPERRHTMVKAIEQAALSTGSEKVISVTASEYDNHVESVELSSNGFEGYRESTVYWAGAMVTVQDEGDRRPNGYHFVGSVSRDGLPQEEEIGKVAAQRALDLLGSKKIKTQTLPVIIEIGMYQSCLMLFSQL